MFTTYQNFKFKKNYSITTVSTNSELQISVSCISEQKIWKNSFQHKFIETLTDRTGNFKRYQIFCKMLQRALEQGSASVFIDILSPAELQTMRMNKVGASKTEGAKIISDE